MTVTHIKTLFLVAIGILVTQPGICAGEKWRTIFPAVTPENVSDTLLQTLTKKYEYPVTLETYKDEKALQAAVVTSYCTSPLCWQKKPCSLHTADDAATVTAPSKPAQPIRIEIPASRSHAGGHKSYHRHSNSHKGPFPPIIKSPTS